METTRRQIADSQHRQFKTRTREQISSPKKGSRLSASYFKTVQLCERWLILTAQAGRQSTTLSTIEVGKESISMSHITTVAVQVRDLNALDAAAKEIGGHLVRDQK